MTILDTYTGAAVAYSLRKLRTAYAGSAIRVRRSSDNTEQDIGFVGEDLDTASLLTFCGAGSGFTTKFYDQSGNANDCVQATLAKQYRIVNAGVLETDAAGKPRTISTAVSSWYGSAAINGGVEPNAATMVGLGKPETGSSQATGRIFGMGDQGTGGTNNWFVAPDGTLRFDGDILTTMTASVSQQIRITTKNGDDYTDWRNAIPGKGGTTTQAVTDKILIGNINGANGNQFQELIVWLSDKSADRNDIGVEINRYWGLYAYPYNYKYMTWDPPAGATFENIEWPVTTNVNTPNTAGYRWNALDSFDIGGTVYQAITFWDSEGYLIVGTRVYGGAWTYHRYDGIQNVLSIQWTNNDNHNTSVIGIDPNGYIHLSYDHHMDPLNYRKSVNPINTFDGEFSAEMSMLGTNETGVTYPHFFRDSNDLSLYFIFRDQWSGDGDLYFYKYDHTTTTWSAAAGTGTGGIIILATPDDLSPYWGGPPVFTSDWDGAGTGLMHFSWGWRQVASTSMHDMSHVQWNGSTFSQADGTAQTMPITKANCAIFDPVPAVRDLGSFSGSAIDGSNRFHAAYDLDNGSDPQLKHAHYDGSAWQLNWATTGSTNVLQRPGIVVDYATNTARILSINSGVGPGLYAWVSDPNDYTVWTQETLTSETVDTTQRLTFDRYQWHNNQSYEALVQIPAEMTPVVTSEGSSTLDLTANLTAVGTINPAAESSLNLSVGFTAVGESPVLAAEGNAVLSTGVNLIGVGEAPIVPVAEGSSILAVSIGTTAVGDAPIVGVSDGSATLNTTVDLAAVGESVKAGSCDLDVTVTLVAVGSAPILGAAEGFSVLAAAIDFIATGSAPTIGPVEGFAVLTVTLSTTAVGSSPGEGTGTYLVLSTISGFTVLRT